MINGNGVTFNILDTEHSSISRDILLCSVSISTSLVDYAVDKAEHASDDGSLNMSLNHPGLRLGQ